MAESSAVRVSAWIVAISAAVSGVGLLLARPAPPPRPVLAAARMGGAPAPPDPLSATVEPSDPAMADGNPDEYAWHLFFFLNRQAGAGAGTINQNVPNLTRNTPGQPVVWETWGLASRNENSDLYGCPWPPGGPKPWAQLATNRPNLLMSKALGANLTAIVAKSRTPLNPVILRGGHVNSGVNEMHFDASAPGSEVRFNQQQYEMVRTQGLWRAEGVMNAIVQAQQRHDSNLVPPAYQHDPRAKAVKAYWVVLNPNGPPNPAVLSRYHWRTDGGVYYGLAALHIMTHDIDKTWFWADFTHRDCLADRAPCNLYPPGTLVSQDTTTAAPLHRRPELGNSVWSNYVLVGSQNNYFLRNGQAQVLGDPLLDPPHTSCASCHSYASATSQPRNGGTVNETLNTLVIGGLPQMGQPQPLPAGFTGAGFSWSMVNNPKAASSGCPLSGGRASGPAPHP